jgi:hypothetical protein
VASASSSDGSSATGDVSRVNNPEFSGNVAKGGLVGGVVVALAVGTVIAANVAGFPEVEGVELLAVVAGEPVITPLLIGLGASGPGIIAGGVAGGAATEPMQASATDQSSSQLEVTPSSSQVEQFMMPRVINEDVEDR